MSRQWYLSFVINGPEDEKRLHWLVRTLQSDPHVEKVSTDICDMPHSSSYVIVTFVKGQDCPRGATLQSLDHTHGDKSPGVPARPTIWQRLLHGIGV